MYLRTDVYHVHIITNDSLKLYLRRAMPEETSAVGLKRIKAVCR